MSSLNYSASSTVGRLEKIYVQKWIHFGFLQSIQSWSEYRRTGILS
ncbi:SusD/RagB family nutrient-binding outer membrane lipoprotein [Saccharicrinis fermentans]